MRADIAKQVLEFYRELPFNCRESVDEQKKAIANKQLINVYPMLPGLLGKADKVLEIGCGCGWLSNAISYHYDVDALGIDFNPVAVERAMQVRDALSLGTRFQVADLFDFNPEEAPFDLVVSLGVLHHTGDCHGAVSHVCNNLVRPGGHCLIGLYHKYGRKPFLDYFAEMQAAGSSESEMFQRYAELHSRISDETLLRSWFRDQVLHPHETQHTQREMTGLLEELGMELLATSVNRFKPLTPGEDLDKLEEDYEGVAREYLEKRQYFPGFFVFLARKR